VFHGAYYSDIPHMTATEWNLYHDPTANGTVPPLQPTDSVILEIGPQLEDHFPGFSAIQTNPSCRFHLAVDFPGLRRNGSSP